MTNHPPIHATRSISYVLTLLWVVCSGAQGNKSILHPVVENLGLRIFAIGSLGSLLETIALLVLPPELCLEGGVERRLGGNKHWWDCALRRRLTCAESSISSKWILSSALMVRLVFQDGCSS